MRFLRFAPLAFALVTGCTLSTGNTAVQSTGHLQVRWTVGGLADATDCTDNGASGARIDVIDANGAKVNGGSDSQSCDAFGVTFPGTFAVGSYRVAVTLLGVDGAAVTTTASSTVTVVDSETAEAAFDFPTSSFLHPATTTGKLEVYWSIEGSKDATFCSSHNVANARVDVLSSGTKVNTGGDTQACTAFGTSFADPFTAGTYEVDVTLLDASGNALTTTVSASATVPSDGTTGRVDVDFPATSFF
ncbi:MAG: hypothetical protein ACXVEF_04740 [Polyangiales bacterium]